MLCFLLFLLIRGLNLSQLIHCFLSAFHNLQSNRHDLDTVVFQICPICAALPGGDPNHVTDDFTAHLTLEHRAARDLISFLLCCTILFVCLCGVRSLCHLAASFPP